MSKISEQKAKQGYTTELKLCSNCNSCITKTEIKKNMFGDYKKELLYCGVGGFAVKKMGTCDEHKLNIGDRG